jgi:uncharacterized membrane protein
MKRYFSVFSPIIAAFMLSNCGESRHTSASKAQAPAAVQAETSAPAAPIPVTTAAPILASGADPEWSIHVEAGIITVKNIDGTLSIYPFVKPRLAAGSATFAIGEGSYATTLILESGPCGDRTFKTTDNTTAKASMRACLTRAQADAALMPAFAGTAAAFASLGCEEAPSEVVDAGGKILGYLQRGRCAATSAAPAPATESPEP